MAKYEVMSKFFDGERLWDPALEEDQFIVLSDDQEPSEVLKPLDAAGGKAVKRREEKEEAKQELNRRSSVAQDPLALRELFKSNPSFLRGLNVEEDAPQEKKSKAKPVQDTAGE